MKRRGDADEGPEGDRPMTLFEHLEELRRRVIWCAIAAAVACGVCAYYEEALLGLALSPVADVLSKIPGGHILVTEHGEMFFTGMKVDIVAGLFFSGPLILWFLWGFVARGLYAREKRWVRMYAPISYVLFLGGCVFFYFVIQPYTLDFLLNYHAKITTLGGAEIQLQVMPTLKNTVSFFLTMSLVMGLVFELPLVMLFLQAIHIADWRTYWSYQRHFIFGLLVFAAVVTPTTDAFTLSIFMLPMLALFEGGILVCRLTASKEQDV